MTRVFRRRLLLPVLLLAFAAVISTGCGIKIGQSVVENRTSEPLVIGVFYNRCDGLHGNPLSSTRFGKTNPGFQVKLPVFASDKWNINVCIVASTVDHREWAVAPGEIKKRYAVTRTEGGLQVRQTGDYPQGDLKVPIWVFIGFGIALLVGSLPGLFFTIQFFWGYYVRHNLGGKPIHPPPAPPPQPVVTTPEAVATPEQTSAGAALLEATRSQPAAPAPVPGVTPDANETSS
jgi:hypothetical protein